MDHTNVVHLPTAATNPVIQPVYRMQQRLRRTTIEFPGEYICQSEREHIAEREALSSVFRTTEAALLIILMASLPLETLTKAYDESEKLAKLGVHGEPCESGQIAHLIMRHVWKVAGGHKIQR